MLKKFMVNFQILVLRVGLGSGYCTFINLFRLTILLREASIHGSISQ